MKSYLKILKFIVPYWFIAILAPLFLMVEVYMTLLIPKTTGQIIDIGIETKNQDVLIQLSLMMLLYTFLTVVFAFLSNFFANWASAEMVNDIRVVSFKKALNMSFPSLDEFETGKVITRVTSDTNNLRWITRGVLRIVFRAPFLLFGAVYMVFNLSSEMAYILYIIIPLLFLSNYIIVKKSYPKYRKIQEKMDNVNMLTQENLENIRVVKAFNRQDYENEKFDKSISELMDATIKANVISNFNAPIFNLIMNMSIVTVLWIAGNSIKSNYMIGDIVEFLGYLGQITMALNMITHLINMIPRAAASSTRIVELLEARTEITTNEKPLVNNISGKIEFMNVTFAYKDTTVLKDISFTLNPGEKLGIIGTTGSGKTSLVNLIPRYYDVSSGSVLIDDIDVRLYDVHTLRKQISTVMQKALLFAGSIEDNIRFGNMSATQEEIDDASRNAEAFDFITSFNESYSSILGERGINLSGGQKQRVSMARSILTKPKILIFDDSTSAVDMTTEAHILNSLKQNFKDTTLIIIAQRIRSVINADKIIVLENGRMTGFGTHSELLQTNPLYKEIYDTQIGADNDEKN